jgi:phycoerythrin alpha chain
LQQPGQSADTPEKVKKCYRDIRHYLRLINYCLVVGTTWPLDEWGIAGQREVYRAFYLPTAPYVAALSYFKENIIAPRDLSEEALVQFQIYLDYLISSLS